MWWSGSSAHGCAGLCDCTSSTKAAGACCGKLLQVCGQRKWQLTELDADPHDYERDQVGVTMTLTGSKIINAAQVLTNVEGVAAVLPADEEPD